MEFFDILRANIRYSKLDPATSPVSITTVYPDYQNVGNLLWSDAPAGVFEVSLSVVWQYDTNKKSGYLRYTLDGTTWYETSEEPKDRTDTRHASYTFPIEHSGGDIDFRVEFSRESCDYVMDIHFCDLTLKRIG